MALHARRRHLCLRLNRCADYCINIAYACPGLVDIRWKNNAFYRLVSGQASIFGMNLKQHGAAV